MSLENNGKENNKEGTIRFPSWVKQWMLETIAKENNRNPVHWYPRSDQVTRKESCDGERKRKKVIILSQEHNITPLLW